MDDVERTADDFYQNYQDRRLEGDIPIPDSPSHEEAAGRFDTLDEPIKATFMRDLKAVGVKFFHVLYPREKKTLLRDWDLWGPLLICIYLALMLQGSTEEANHFSDGGPAFAQVFVIVWLGAVVVTLNSKLLGGKISFFQSVCVLGYCMLPPSISLAINSLILMAGKQTLTLFIVRFVVTVAGFFWATYASVIFLGDSHPREKKALAVYPIFLFYFVISWMVIATSSVGH